MKEVGKILHILNMFPYVRNGVYTELDLTVITFLLSLLEKRLSSYGLTVEYHRDEQTYFIAEKVCLQYPSKGEKHDN